MLTTDHAFVREPALDASAYCPDCREPWEFCACELPEYADVLEIYERGRNPLMTTTVRAGQGNLAKLREPFPPNQVSQLPKETRKQAEERKAGQNIEWKCGLCGGTHHKNAVHLSYVGHAALTDRLLDVDPEWSWEPVGFTQDGLPAIDPRFGGLWIRLTVCGVSRYGFGAADGKAGGDAMKEMIGDALRNAAMRFGAALDLWHKGDLHVEEEVDAETGEVARTNGNGRTAARDDPFPPGPAKNKTELKAMVSQLWREVEGCGDPDELDALIKAKENVQLITQCVKAIPKWWEGTARGDEQYEGLEAVISRKQTELAIAAMNAG